MPDTTDTMYDEPCTWSDTTCIICGWDADTGDCLYDPVGVKGPIGMYHCPACDAMVVAGIKHPRRSPLCRYPKETEVDR